MGLFGGWFVELQAKKMAKAMEQIEYYQLKERQERMCDPETLLGGNEERRRTAAAQFIADIVSNYVGARVSAGTIQQLLTLHWTALKRDALIVVGKTVGPRPALDSVSLEAARAIDDIYAAGCPGGLAQRTAKVQTAVREAIETYAGRCR